MATRTAAATAAKARIRDAAQGRILDAAAEVFSERGPAAATVAEIAARADMPTATVHYYFGSKTALYDAVLSQVLDLWLSEIDRIDTQGPPEEALSAYIRAKMRVSFAHPAASRIVAGEILRGGAKIESFVRDELLPHLQAKLDLVEHWRRSNRVRPVDPRTLFFLIWASTEFYATYASEVVAVRGVERLTEAEFETASDAIADIILRGALPRARD
ncbi:TetR family transcriptional regulator C-terminal domain-containing protein [Hansschlegelia quercus]|uniref:TetR/AcrR family transcriptional regulator n=1 Tax=Hansschlegelia quercus TaxID=2528245 RepID=A0A4Q9GLE3_9HYPH|nr:TetR family transcriptional regulator C-terminal domain-containing protein [Hansschlegelia quercus]TBN55229.1 TetR/AcrR family transcriptional regulator [Hansschlegelia quercus]